MAKYIMAFDQGTSSSRCIIFNNNCEIISVAQKEITSIYPKSGWVEQDPMSIWSSQLAVATEALARVMAGKEDISSIGITNQRETTIVWEKSTGKPIYNAIVWQCRRTSEYCDSLKAEGFEKIVKEKTGLIIDAYFSATKVKWILDNIDGAREMAEKGELLFGTVDTWIMWNLTKGKVHATDYSNASRTMMFNIHTLEWDKDILEKLNIPISMLPEVKPSSFQFGKTFDGYFGGEIPICGVAGDQQAALFGQGCFSKGSIKNTYGTGCFILMNIGETPTLSENGLLTTIAWGLNGKVTYAIEGSVFIAGAAIKWLRDGLRMIDGASYSEVYATKVSDSDGIYVVPAFVGLGAPYWDQYARGIVIGLTGATRKEHFIRATLESLAYQSYDVIKAMETDTNINLEVVKVDGGACANDFIMQFQSDILNINVRRPKIIESTALGVVFLAGLASGFFKDLEEITNILSIEKEFKPNMEEEKRKYLIDGWSDAVSRCLGWAKYR